MHLIGGIIRFQYKLVQTFTQSEENYFAWHQIANESTE